MCDHLNAVLLYGFRLRSQLCVSASSLRRLQAAGASLPDIEDAYEETCNSFPFNQVLGLRVDGRCRSGINSDKLKAEDVAQVELLHRVLKAAGVGTTDPGFYPAITGSVELYHSEDFVIELDEALEATEEGKALLQELGIEPKPE